MRTILTTMILTVCMGLFGQVQIQLHPGDHVYLLDSPGSTPAYYQVDQDNMKEIVGKYLALTDNGFPVCEVFFDPQNYENINLRKGDDGTIYVRSIADKLNPSVVAINDDPGTQPVFQGGKIIFQEDRYLMIYTPHLARATSFKLQTNNRVFVIVRQQSLTAKQL